MLDLNNINQVGSMAYLVGAYRHNPDIIYRIIRRFHNRTLSRRDFWVGYWIPFRETNPDFFFGIFTR